MALLLRWARGFLCRALVLGALVLTLGGMATVAFAAPLSQAATTVTVSTNAALGRILTDAAGRTLYHYTKDTSGVSTCTGGCATVWPPFRASPPLTLPAGVSGTLTLITRPDGSKQVAYNGEALYYYAADSGPGDTMGQGIGGLWFVVNAPTVATAAITTTTSSATRTASAAAIATSSSVTVAPAAVTTATTTTTVVTTATTTASPTAVSAATTSVATTAQVPSQLPNTGAGGLAQNGQTAVGLLAALALGLVVAGRLGRRRSA
jgi:predicted lipoprotein with Yx(FWY)xxD motif